MIKTKPLVVIDTSVVMYYLFDFTDPSTNLLTEQEITERCEKAYKLWSSLFFMKGIENGDCDVLWCGDHSTYWRKKYFKNWAKKQPDTHPVHRIPNIRRKKDESEESFAFRKTDSSLKMSMQGYKGNRFKNPLKTTAKNIMNKVCKAVTLPKAEADDVIAATTKLFNDRKVYIATVDSDLLQLVSDSVIWLCLTGYDPGFRDTENALVWFNRKLDKEPEFVRETLGEINSVRQIVDWKMLRGDVSDNLPPGSPRELIDLLNPPEEYRYWETPGLQKKLQKRIKSVEILSEDEIIDIYEWFYSIPVSLAYRQIEIPEGGW